MNFSPIFLELNSGYFCLLRNILSFKYRFKIQLKLLKKSARLFKQKKSNVSLSTIMTKY